MRKTLMTILAGLVGGTAAWAQTAVQPIGFTPGNSSTPSTNTATGPTAVQPIATAGKRMPKAAPIEAVPTETETDTTETEPETLAESETDATAAMLPVTILFEFDKSNVDGASALAAAKAYIDAHPDHYLVLEGHTDPVGTFEYNAGLATRRGENVRSELIELGADPERLVVGVYGEAVLVSPDDAQNRRVVIRGTTESIDQITKRTFEDGMAVVWSYEARPEVVAARE